MLRVRLPRPVRLKLARIAVELLFPFVYLTQADAEVLAAQLLDFLDAKGSQR
ncbi:MULTISPECIES: hypothetical protein [unclassified Corallococcus]|uniref:hypothetical protein n=1 Tax=unclassified Corallococcus TaxID=2685029 RepID=UPI001A8E3E74|nr:MULTISPECIES: hypothetical protein [unclassified Corallococcus]MBN9685386.1 hypothetical protein [Corallococcus sp. NCSPR001]WAS83163.1 hypothetical protein O0N60_28060 [Corallococcus sp. NCRR]